MAEPALVTYFASPERIEHEELFRQHVLLTRDEGLCTLIDAMPEFVMIVGPTREILLGNRALVDFAASQGCSDLTGLRPGELLSCENARTAPAGCGTAEACQCCGAVEAILSALSGSRSSHECHLLRSTNRGLEALDLKVWGTPFRWQGESLALVVAVDISDEKRRKVLERIFFHDILNTAGAIGGLAELLVQGIMNPDDVKETLLDAARTLVSEIRSQRELLAAENNELSVAIAPIHSRLFLESIARTYRNTPLAQGREIRLDKGICETIVFSDERLLQRVMGNLVKNALEAVQEGETVTLGCEADGEEVAFWCNNPGVIPRKILLQLFQRSFSTKEPGRGIGTYSVRLLTERYLKGRVETRSDAETGTTFTVVYPLDLRTAVERH